MGSKMTTEAIGRKGGDQDKDVETKVYEEGNKDDAQNDEKPLQFSK